MNCVQKKIIKTSILAVGPSSPTQKMTNKTNKKETKEKQGELMPGDVVQDGRMNVTT